MDQFPGKPFCAALCYNVRHMIRRLRKSKYFLPAVIVLLAVGIIGAYLIRASKTPRKPIAIPFSFTEMQPLSFLPNTCAIKDYGAIGDGATLDTKAFQAAIDDCAQKGGGTVEVSSGTFLTGAIRLKSNIDLHLADGSRVLFSANPDDYLPAVFTRWEGIELYNYSPLIYGQNIQNVAITGKGTLDGQGQIWLPWKDRATEAAQHLYDMARNGVPVEQRIFATQNDALRPSFIEFINAQNVRLENFSITNSPMWTIHPLYSENVLMRDLHISTTGENTDGIVIDSSKNVLVEDSELSTGDDAISIKSGLDQDGLRVGRPSENIVIRDSIIDDGHSGVAIGSEMSGGVRDVLLQNLKINNVDQGIRIKSALGRGGVVENIWADEINVIGTKSGIGSAENSAFQIDLGYDAATTVSSNNDIPVLHNFYITGLRVGQAQYIVFIKGLKESVLKNISFTDTQGASKLGVHLENCDKVSFSQTSISAEKNSKLFKIKNCSNVSR